MEDQFSSVDALTESINSKHHVFSFLNILKLIFNIMSEQLNDNTQILNLSKMKNQLNGNTNYLTFNPLYSYLTI